MAAQSFQLLMRTGPNPGKIFSLTDTEIYIGRDISNNIVITDAEISRKHARLLNQAGQFLIEDLGSTNGTFINGVRLAGPHMLQPGEVIQLGENVTVVFEATQYDPDATIAMSQPPTAGFPQEAAPAQFTPPPPPAAAPYHPSQVPPPPVAEGGVKKKSSTRKWVFAGVSCLVLFACVLIPAAVLWYIDTQNLWCEFFPFLPGC